MFLKIKNVLSSQSVIQLTLFRIIASIFTFLIIFMFIYGQNYWSKKEIKLNYTLLSIASDTQSKIQSQISSIEESKQDQSLTRNQKRSKITSIIQPIINKNNNNAVSYYDLELDLILLNENITKISLDELRSTMLSKKDSNSNLIDNDNDNDNDNNTLISINVPVYNEGKLVGYVWTNAKKADYILISFDETSKIIILVLLLSVIIIFSIRNHIKQIELYLDKFCKMIINNHDEQDEILTKLPELKPVLDKISYYTDDLKQMNLELESSRLNIYRILEGISDGFYALDRNWLFTYVNKETQKLICEENTELLGKTIWEVFPQVIGSLNYDKMHEAMAQEESIHWEAEGFTSSDQFYEYHAYPFKEGLTVFFRDITELRRQKQEIDRLERLNLIGQLAAGISHEIRNPLTTVKGFLQIFGSRSKYEQDKENMELMISEIDRANAIITDFLSLAKANLDYVKPQNINEIINKVLPMLQADAYNNDKEVIIDLYTVPDIMINENEIKQLILNLVRNGLDVTPEQSSVIISTYLKEDKVVLSIEDQGTGIPQEIQKKIGTPFFTTKETGTGLGLAISIGIAQRHKAIFEFKTGNNGTIFYIIFPNIMGQL